MPEQIPVLSEARTNIDRIERDPLAVEAAGDELESARSALADAERAYQNDEDLVLIEHRAYLANRHALIAEQQIAEAHAMDELEDSEAARNEVLLQVQEQRTRRAEAVAQANAIEAEVQEARAESAVQRAQSLARELEAVQAEENERGLVLTLGDILFDTDEAMLKPGAAMTLNRLANFLQEFPDRRVLVEGHADARGPRQYNVDLSERRAESVEDALVDRAIDSGRIRVAGLGEAFPVASNETVAGMQQNRRVEIVISDPDGAFPDAAMDRVASLGSSG
jgi:outer membrane protein OmpA-like peptidoglycan-associated protein